MKRLLSLQLVAGLVSIGAGAVATSALAVVDGDLLTNSSQTTGWQDCAGSNSIIDPALLAAGGCAYRETPVTPGVTYKLSCGVTSTKFSSITLAFLDAADNTLATETTEIFEEASGAFSVTLAAPTGSTTGAVGIYGEEGSGFQDCVLIENNPVPEPTDGSISGTAWFDANDDGLFNSDEAVIPGTPVSIFQNGALVDQGETDLDGAYNFAGLDIDQCYNLLFGPADATLQFGVIGGDNDAVNNGATLDVCLDESTPNVADVDAGFAAVPPVLPPADYSVCGRVWIDSNADGVRESDEEPLAQSTVELLNVATGDSYQEETNASGRYSFDSLPAGDYKLQFTAPSGYSFTTGMSAPSDMGSFAMDNGMTPNFNLPASSNTGADAACTILHADAGVVPEPVALEPTVAADDEVEGFIGDALTVDVLANDTPCEGSVSEVNLIGHNVPGNVVFNVNSQIFEITDTTEAGTFTIEYGIRGNCGSYATAEITVVVEEAPLPPAPNAPDEPYGCQIETGGAAWGGVDIFSTTQYGFASNYNLYDVDKNLVFTGSSSNVSHHVFFNDQWEIEWEGLEYGYDQLSIYYVSVLENGVESNLVACPRRAISPIALDVNDSGAVEYIRGEFSFDLTGDGIAEELMAWFGPEEGILVSKDFGDEISGEHLFGNENGQYSDGFAKLGKLDLNRDKLISGSELESLAIWTDKNSNTRVDDGEMSSIASHRIVNLAVDHYKFFARAALENGDTMIMQDLWFPMTPLAKLDQ